MVPGGSWKTVYEEKSGNGKIDEVVFDVISARKATIKVQVVSKEVRNNVKVDSYGVVTSKIKPGKKAVTAKIQVTCGNKKEVVTVIIAK